MTERRTEVPSPPKAKPSKEIEAVVAALRASRVFQTGRLQIREGARWRLVSTTIPCSAPQEPAIDGGAPADASVVEAGAP